MALTSSRSKSSDKTAFFWLGKLIEYSRAAWSASRTNATNIGEDLIFVVDGRDLRHKRGDVA